MMVDGHCPFEIVILWESHIFRHTRLDVQNHGFLKLIPYSPAMVLKTWKYGKNMPTTLFETWTQIPYSPAMKLFEVKQPRHLHC